MDTNIKFKQDSADNAHLRQLRSQLKNVLKNLPKRRRHNKQYMAIALPLLFMSTYLIALQLIGNIYMFCMLYAVLGVISVLVFINIIHDAVHDNVFKKRWANNALLSVFDLLGGNSFIWKKRHMILHHNFQNIAGWDSDIEQAGLIKVYPQEKASLINRNQHWLIFLFYPMYLFNWIFVRDFKDFFMKNRLIKKVCKIPLIEFAKLFFFKVLFFYYILIIPINFGASKQLAFVALCLMFITGSVFALLSLLTPHVNETNKFPAPNSSGEMQVTWLEHQFITTNDIKLNNWFTRNLMGNFNFHLAHHLFPRISSVYAPEITKVIRDYALENGFAYRSYHLKEALIYHYRLIKANAFDVNLFEEDM